MYIIFWSNFSYSSLPNHRDKNKIEQVLHCTTVLSYLFIWEHMATKQQSRLSMTRMKKKAFIHYCSTSRDAYPTVGTTSVVTWARDDANVIDIIFITYVRPWNCDDTSANSDSLLPTMTCYTSQFVFFARFN